MSETKRRAVMRSSPRLWGCFRAEGGCIGLRALARGLPVKAAVFSAPMWGIAMAAWLRPVASVMSALAAPLGLTTRYAPSTSAETYLLQVPFQGNVLTTDREMWGMMKAHLAAEPRFGLGGPTLRWLRAAPRRLWLAPCRGRSPASPSLG